MADLSYNLIKNGLDMSSLRQKNISSNLANANTPNYKVNRVNFESMLNKARNGIAMDKTHPMHYGVSNLSDVKPEVSKRTDTAYNDNGNNVDIDLEMSELAANEIYYNMLIRQINSKYSNLSYVINR